MDFHLHPEQPTGAEIIRVIRDQVEDAEQTVRDRTLSARERVHAARIACKKVRAVLHLIRADEPHFYARENAWFRDSARQLSKLRDADVMLATFDALVRRDGRIDRDGFTPLRQELRAHRQATAPAAASAQRWLARFAGRMRQAARRLALWKPRGADFSAVSPGLRKTYRRARRAFAAAYTKPKAGAFHEWRKAAKTHGYQYRLLRGAWPGVMKKWQAEVSVLGDVLGEDHDLSTLHDWLLHGHTTPRADGAVRASIRLIDRRREALHRIAQPIGHRLFAETPKAALRRLERWWQAAHDINSGQRTRGD